MAKTEQLASKKKVSKLGFILLGVVFLIIALVVVADATYQQRIGRLKDANQQIWTDVVKPAGGADDTSKVRGGHFWEVCVDNGPCPAAISSWWVLVERNETASKQQVLESLKKNGYEVSDMGRQFGGVKNGVSVNLTFSSPDQSPPYEAPEGKTWKLLGADTFELSK